MSLFKKTKRVIRQRIKTSDSEGEDDSRPKENKSKLEIVGEDLSSGKIPKTLPQSAPLVNTDTVPKQKIKSKEDKPTRQNVLSFGDDDEEEEVFKVKKSTQSRRLAKLIEKERKQKKAGHNTSSNANNDNHHTVDDIQISNKNNQNNESELIVVNGEEAEEMDVESEGEIKYRDPFKKIFESGAIPDAAMIHAARKRRQQAREMGDFISIDENEAAKSNSHSRLVRDDDNDKSDEDDDDSGRLSFTVDTAARDREKVREAILAINQHKGDESGGEDEELQRWEEEQIRKGVNIPQVVVTTEAQENHYYSQCFYTPVRNFDEPVTASVPQRGPARDVSFKSFSPDAVKERLVSRLRSLKETYRGHQLELEKVKSLTDSSESRIKELEKEAPEVSRSFTFYQETRGYVTDLVECLNEKMSQINALENAMHNLLKQRATKLILRRQQDIKDQADEFSKLSSKMNSSNPMDNWIRDKASAAEENLRIRRAAEREGRRSRRRKVRESKINELKHYEGMSSDDEETDADVIRFNAERDRILRDCSTVFDDVVEDFSSLGNMKHTFENWRNQYPDTYREAYIGLCLPKVFSPLVKLQLIGWNPLQECRTFEDMAWYETLVFYGCDERTNLDTLRKDPDINLVPLVVDRVVIPKLTNIVEDIWDPMSTSQTLRLVSLIKKMVENYPTLNSQSNTTKTLLQTLVARIRKTLDEDVFVPLYPKALLENTSANVNAFFQRQFWSCVKLFHNILSWQGSLSDTLLQELALDCLLNRYILLGLQTWLGGCDVEKCQMITSRLPRTWFVRLTNDRTLPQLEMFCRFLKNLANSLDVRTINVPGTPLLGPKTGVEQRDALKETVKILVSIRAINHALELANQHPHKELKSLININSC
ncbi:GC-rich sequence DNA-binding factor [Chamberlinius hualienensis]